MSPEINLWRRNGYYLLIWVILWVSGGIFLSVYGYQESFLKLNQLNNQFFDAIMPHITHLGHGVVVAGLLLLFDKKTDPLVAFSLILTLLLIVMAVSFGKFYLFPEWDRPARVFDLGNINFISLLGEKNQSFPSGHSAAAAGSFFYLTLVFKNASPRWGIFAALMAAVAAYSRLYIGVHFLGDLLAGSLLGVALAAVSWWIFAANQHRSFLKYTRIHSSKFQTGIKILAAIALAIDTYVIITQNYL